MTMAASAILLMSLPSSAALGAGPAWQRTPRGIVVRPKTGPEQAVRLQVYSDRIIRVTESADENFDTGHSVDVIASPEAPHFTVSQTPAIVVLSTGKIRASIELATGRVRFVDAQGRSQLAEYGRPRFAPVTIEGAPFVSIRQQFNRGTTEGLFGLGQHQFGQMNYNGEDVELAQHNMDVAIPFLVSTRNYGLLWDNPSITRFGNPRPYGKAGAQDDGLEVNGGKGWSATYRVNGRIVAARHEPLINYQYLENRTDWPAGTRLPDLSNTVAGLSVTWEGRAVTPKTGLHRFRLYSSGYAEVFVDGRKVLDRWRQSWNPFYHLFDVRMTAGKPVDIRVQWKPDGGYIALEHAQPRPEPDRHAITFSSEAAHAIDYYYIGGDTLDQVIGGYRKLTGKAVILPQWAYGFWQSRQRYESENQLLEVVREYRKRGLPLDNIVQDWLYWPQDAWGCQCFDPVRFPDPKGMVDQVHAAGAHIMISVWAKYYKGLANYNELDGVNGVYRNMVDPLPSEPKDPAYIKDMYLDWVGPGYFNAFYDPYNRRAKAIYWRQVNQGIASQGFDAFWLDSDEPDFHSNISRGETARRMGPAAEGPALAVFNSYPLKHVDNVYQGWTATRPDVRPFILTRSAFEGIQRDSAAVWSGDVASRWDNFKEQISAGINFSLSGVPNWTHDIGGYTMEPRFQDPSAADLDEWRELNLRWFQFGAFSPLFRSHGENIHREIYEIAPAGSLMYRSMEFYDRLRYRLMPYIYTLAGDTYWSDGTIMRGLVMDFPGDRRAWAIKDEYLFGPDLLVAPVTRYKARSRSVYLPAGASWYDFYTGQVMRGGQEVTIDAPVDRIPLFVRAGSIIPTGPAIQYTGQPQDHALTLNVYTGAAGTGSVYEDDGLSRQYLSGKYSRIPLSYDEATHTLNIGQRMGSFPGMRAMRTIRVRWMTPGRALDLDAADKILTYTGAALALKMP